MIENIKCEKREGINVLSCNVSTGVNLKVCAGSQGVTGGDSTVTYFSINSENAQFEFNDGTDGFEMILHGDLELFALAQALEFAANVIKSRIDKDVDV